MSLKFFIKLERYSFFFLSFIEMYRSVGLEVWVVMVVCEWEGGVKMCVSDWICALRIDAANMHPVDATFSPFLVHFVSKN